MRAGTQEGWRGFRTLHAGVTGGCEPSEEVLLERGPFAEQQVLWTAEPSLRLLGTGTMFSVVISALR